jgi:hypothetical protein
MKKRWIAMPAVLSFLVVAHARVDATAVTYDFTLIAADGGPLTAFNSNIYPAVNGAGAVAFQAWTNAGAGGQGIFLSEGAVIDIVAQTSLSAESSQALGPALTNSTMPPMPNRSNVSGSGTTSQASERSRAVLTRRSIVGSLCEPQQSAPLQTIERDPGVFQSSGERESVHEAGIEFRHTGARSRFRFVVSKESAHRIDQKLPFGRNHHSEFRDFVLG